MRLCLVKQPNNTQPKIIRNIHDILCHDNGDITITYKDWKRVEFIKEKDFDFWWVDNYD